MKDERLKYLEIVRAFPERAGKLAQTLTTLKRLIEKEARKKQTDDVKALLICASELVDVGFEFNEWSKNTWTSVLKDYQDLEQVAKLNDIIKDQQLTITYYEQLSRPHKATA